MTYSVTHFFTSGFYIPVIKYADVQPFFMHVWSTYKHWAPNRIQKEADIENYKVKQHYIKLEKHYEEVHSGRRIYDKIYLERLL